MSDNMDCLQAQDPQGLSFEQLELLRTGVMELSEHLGTFGIYAMRCCLGGRLTIGEQWHVREADRDKKESGLSVVF